MERQEEERMRAYIKAPFSLTFVLSVWRATMNINMNPWRGNTVFFPSFFVFFFFFLLGYSCTQEETIQVDLMGNL